ncbi:uncharacterized protein DUF4249 [Algoriphagus boseongensis]|uniref:Uncharacterized protein DUF4249 n=1 Tax=Algoriphagus boseongensis TaxID=1442587 RepID=A0A4R6T5G0_9BACT|nr:DUF4249 domain-containing protein [Algoriphagus boseongensis]TDQ14760.1 uncharacterized protein DUF4249 [Algoriphagus boseongensis]
MKQVLKIVFVVLIALQACRTPFDPEIPSKEISFLVVEGYLDTEGKRSELKLSRTVPLDSSTSFSPEKNASVILSSQSGQQFQLQEEEPGIYVFERNVPEQDVYNLEIFLANGERFKSKPLKPILTPPIIDAGFQKDEEGVEVFVTTKGDENADDFLWTFEESWIYRPRIRTAYIYDSKIGTVRDRTAEEDISLCFKNESSPDILLETSSRFQDQVVFKQTITEIPTGDERIMERYSILISQKAIAQEDVAFWEILKKNTEDIGSIFSPLPSLIGGNISSVDNPNSPVIGQVSMGVVQEKRIYINRVDVSPWNYLDPQFNDCIISLEPVFTQFYASTFGSGFVLPTIPLMAGTTIVGYYVTDKRCADCTLYASPVKPEFWEDE